MALSAFTLDYLTYTASTSNTIVKFEMALSAFTLDHLTYTASTSKLRLEGWKERWGFTSTKTIKAYYGRGLEDLA